MASYLTSNTLLESIKRRGAIPTSQVTFQDEDLLALANEEVLTGLVPAMLQYHEEYMVYSKEVPFEANVSKYTIPDRAIGNRLRTIFVKESSNGTIREMSRVSADNIYFFERINTGTPFWHYYVENNSIVIVPTITGLPAGSLLMKYFQRPNSLVMEDRIATITAINTGTGEITVDSVPSVFSISTPLDLIEVGGGHRVLALDQTATAINTTTKIITISPANIPSDLVVGDNIALAGECKIPQVPDDLHPILAQRVICRCLDAQGALQELTSANTKLAEMELKMGNLIDNRVEGNPIKANNLRSLLREGKIRRRRGFY